MHFQFICILKWFYQVFSFKKQFVGLKLKPTKCFLHFENLKKPLAILDSITLASNIKNLGENTKPKCTTIKKPNSKVQNEKSKCKM